jgi:hypothetical protein
LTHFHGFYDHGRALPSLIGPDGSTAAPRRHDRDPQAARAAIDVRWSAAIRIFKRDRLEQMAERTYDDHTRSARTLGLQRTYRLSLIHELAV